MILKWLQLKTLTLSKPAIRTFNSTNINRSSYFNTISSLKHVNKISTEYSKLEHNEPKRSEIDQGKLDEIMEDSIFSDVKLDSFKVIPEIVKMNLNKHFKLKVATKVQDQLLSRWPIQGDAIIKSHTGSGKTLAYLIPSIETMLRTLSPEETSKGKQVSVLILVPTRELVLQISQNAKKLLKGLPFHLLSFIGGTSRVGDLSRVSNKRVDIIVATPGRIVDIISSSRVFRTQLQQLKLIVLDEADELINRGFLTNILTIFKNLPKDRKTMMFSATMPEQLDDNLMKKIFNEKQEVLKIDVTPKKEEVSTHIDKLDQKYIISSHNFHPHLIYGILSQPRFKKIILFLPTVISVQIISGLYKEMGIKIYEMHGQLDQKERLLIAEKFQHDKKAVLITTDISARGMDYSDVDLVIQWGSPASIDAYKHRIGRTARAGKKGTSILVLTEMEKNLVKRLGKNGLKLDILDLDHEIPKPASDNLHKLNMLCSKIKPSIIKQFYNSNFTYYLSLCSLLYISRKNAHSQVKNMIKGLGQEIPNFSKLPKEIQESLATVDKAKSLLVKRKGYKRSI
ncbi:DEAD-domain-containing protein [Neoconidiobolus thromboides FSU 785]|nr:DEAD-domain-containing protein [Neoconidiobolus thromboides FSU 785]